MALYFIDNIMQAIDSDSSYSVLQRVLAVWDSLSHTQTQSPKMYGGYLLSHLE